MRRVLFTLAVTLVFCAASFAQATQPQSTPPASGTTAQPGTQTQPGAPTQPGAQAQPGAAATPGAAQAAPTRTLPQAKSAEEYQAFTAAVTNTDLGMAEAAASEFVTKFPDSELKGLLYRQLMQMYQQANNAEKMIEMGRRAIQYSPNDPVPLVMTATVISDKTKTTDLDRDERLAEAMKYAQRTLETVDANMLAQPSDTPEQIESQKKLIRSLAHAALGTAEMVRENNAAAEKHLQEAVQLNTERPDALTWLRLALAQDKQKKYKEALVSATRAEELAGTDSTVRSLATQEKQRLVKLTAAPGAATTPAPKPATPAPPK